MNISIKSISSCILSTIVIGTLCMSGWFLMQGQAFAKSSPTIAADRFQKLGIASDSWSEAQIRFWFRMFTEFTTHDSILHDPNDLSRIYAVIEDPKKISATKAALAATGDRVRLQIGQKDRLENAYPISKIYLKRMEEMFEEEGVPKELTRLPFVESGFVKDARSSVGAIGIWQFMPKTAQKDLRVDAAIDERLDPLKSTRAAAKYLHQNYLSLKNWGLAIMAYHHGPGLVMKAVKILKTHDPVTLIRLFKNPSFQFASRNYLFEFLAMLDVDAVHESFFKKEAAKLPEYITVSFPQKMFMKDVLRKYGLSESLTKILNPHFKDTVWKNERPIPAHYPLRITGVTLERFRSIQ